MASQLTIAQITDCHLFADSNQCGYADINPYETLDAVLAAVKQHQPEYVLVTGDVSGDHSHTSYKHFTQLWKKAGLEAQLISLAGNHDDIDAWQACFQTSHAYSQYSLLENWHLHLLPSDFVGAQGTINQQGMQQLQHNLNEQPHANHIVALHHPLTKAGVWMDKHHLLNADAMIQCLAKSQITAVVHGHVHTERKVIVEDTPVYACPSTCWQWSNTQQFGVLQQPPGYRLLTLSSDGELNTSVHYVTD